MQAPYNIFKLLFCLLPKRTETREMTYGGILVTKVVPKLFRMNYESRVMTDNMENLYSPCTWYEQTNRKINNLT